MSIKKAVIVAAGLGNRLGDLTKDIPKSLLKIGEESIIERNIRLLKKNNITDIAIVIGYKKEVLKEHLGDGYTYIFNPFFKETNNMGSFWFAKDFIGDDDFIYSHADIIYDEELLRQTLQSDGDFVLCVDEKPCDEEAMKVKVASNLSFIESSKDIALDQSYGEWIGLVKYKNSAWKLYLNEIEELLGNRQFNVYDTMAMNNLAKKYPELIKVLGFKGISWVEVDYIEDYNRALEIFA